MLGSVCGAGEANGCLLKRQECRIAVMLRDILYNKI